MKKEIFSVFFLVTSFISCSAETVDDKDIIESEIYQEYFTDFDENDQRLLITAQFREGGFAGTTIKLSSPSKVEVDNKELKLDDRKTLIDVLSGTFYSYEILNTNIFEKKYQFRWTTKSGVVKEHVLFTANKIAISNISNQQLVDRFKDFEVNISGDQNGFLFCEISIEEQGKLSSISGTINKDKCIFSSKDLRTLPNGNAKVGLRHQVDITTKDSTNVGVRMISYFKSKKIDIVLN